MRGDKKKLLKYNFYFLKKTDVGSQVQFTQSDSTLNLFDSLSPLLPFLHRYPCFMYFCRYFKNKKTQNKYKKKRKRRFKRDEHQ
jgi:hypothetical protein